MKKTLTDWKYLADEDSDDYKFRVVSQFDYKSAKERFDYNLFLKLIKKGASLTEIFVKSCHAEIELIHALEEGDDADCPDMYSYIDDFVYNRFLPKINNNFSYIPLCCYYYNSSILQKRWFNKLDLLSIKSTKENFIIRSGWIDGMRHYSDIIKKIGNKISKKNLIDETIKLMENNAPGVVGISGEFNWNIKKVFDTINTSYPFQPTDDIIEDHAFLFVTKNRSDYESGQHVLQSYGLESIWNVPQIHKKKSKKLIKIMENKFKEHYWYNYFEKKWEKCHFFRNIK